MCNDLAAIVDALPIALVLADSDGRIILITAQAERLFGYARAELLGQPIDRLVPATDANCSAFALRKDGSKLSLDIYRTPIVTTEGQLVLASIFDASRQDEQRAALESELESFSYAVSHDLASPVRAMSGFTRMIAESYGDVVGDEGRRMLSVIRGESARMGDMIDALVKYYRLGRQHMSSTSVDMTALARACADKQAALPHHHNHSIDVDVLPSACGDLALLREVWDNLISNAIKFSDTRDKPQVEITGMTAGGEAIYQVADNGVGFDMNYSNKLFRVFQRLHDADEFPGVCIGLAVVRRIVMRHGGRTWANSSIGEGATFAFSLPLDGT